jgi:YVTN family beta-propeller protein
MFLFTGARQLARWVLAAAVFVSGARLASAGPMAYVGNFKDNTVSVIDTASDSVVATIPVAAGPHGMAITQDGRWLYVCSDGASVLNVIDTTLNQVTRTIEVGRSPHGVALTPDGRTLLAAINGEDRIAFIDLAKQAVVATVSVPKPHTIAIRPDGKIAYVSSQAPNQFALVVIDLPGRSTARIIPLDKPPRDLEFGQDGKAVYFTKAGVNAVQVLDPASDKVVAEIPTGVSPHYVNYLRGTTLGMAVVQGPGELLLFDPVTNLPVRTIPVGKQPHWLAVSADGKIAYVTNEGSDDVSVISIATGKTTVIPVGGQPRKVVVQPIGKEVSVLISNFAFVPASVSLATGSVVAWRNDDGAPHAITFSSSNQVSGTLLPGATFRKTFDQPGTYEYYCSFHNYMRGRIIVSSP